jgi:hypothetical protein
VIRPGTFTSVADLIAANEISIGPWNDRCERFTWTNHSGLHPRQSRPPQEAHTPGGPASRHYGVEIDCGGADVARDERLVSAKFSRPGTGPPRVKATDTCHGPIRQAEVIGHPTPPPPRQETLMIHTYLWTLAFALTLISVGLVVRFVSFVWPSPSLVAVETY